jgi:hypothetical protein
MFFNGGYNEGVEHFLVISLIPMLIPSKDPNSPYYHSMCILDIKHFVRILTEF